MHLHLTIHRSTRRLLLGAALLLPATLPAQFPLPNAGVVVDIETGQPITFRDRRQDIAELAYGGQYRRLTANGDVIEDTGAVVATGCTALSRLGGLAIKGGKVISFDPRFPVPPAVSALNNIVKIAHSRMAIALAADGSAVVFAPAFREGTDLVLTSFGPMDFSETDVASSARKVGLKRILDDWPVGYRYENFSQSLAARFDNSGKFLAFDEAGNLRTGPAPLVFYKGGKYVLEGGVVTRFDSCGSRVIVSNALKFCADDKFVIVKPASVGVTEGTRPLTANPRPPAPARAALKTVRRTTRARLGLAAAAENPLETSSGVFFGRVSVGVTAAAHRRTLTITNDAPGTLNLGTVTVDGDAAGDFAVTSPTVTTLGPGEATDFTVQFTPSATGQRTAALHIASDDADRPSFGLVLNGFGQDTNAAPLTVLDTLTAPAGGGVTFTKLLTNDSDPDGDPIKVTEVASIDGVTKGFVTLQDDGTVAYTSPNEVGTDQFAYTVTDGTVTQTGTVNVNVVDPVELADGLTFRGSEGQNSVTLALSKLPPSAVRLRRVARTLAATAARTPVLTATFSETIDGHTYRGSVRFPADENTGEALLKGSEDVDRTQFEITCDEDGNPRVIVRTSGGIGETIELNPDTFDRRNRAPADLVGTYTMKMPGSSFDGARPADVDSIATDNLVPDGRVLLRGVMADGQSFSGTGYLVDDLTAEFNIPLYSKGRGRLVGELTFDATNPEGTVGGSVTWVKEEGVPGLPYAQAFVTTGGVVGGVYDPDELPGNTVNLTFGTGEDPQGTGTGTLASRFIITGTNATGAFTLANTFARTTGLIIGKRPSRATNGPRTLAAVVLIEQSEVAGNSTITIPAETVSPDLTLPAFTTSTPVTGTFPP